MTSTPVLLDSNILVYLIARKSHGHKHSMDFMNSLIRSKEYYGCISDQNYLESFRVLTHQKYKKPLTSNVARDMLNQYLNVLTIVTPKSSTLQITMDLIAKHKLLSNSVFDAYLVATMISNGISHIATFNVKDFTKYKEITAIDPSKVL